MINSTEGVIISSLLCGERTTADLAGAAGVSDSQMLKVLSRMMLHSAVTRSRKHANSAYLWQIDLDNLPKYIDSISCRNVSKQRERPHATLHRLSMISRAMDYIRCCSPAWVDGDWTSHEHALVWGVYEQAAKDEYGMLKDRTLGSWERRTARMTVRHGIIVDRFGAPFDILGELGICPQWARQQIENSIQMGAQ